MKTSSSLSITELYLFFCLSGQQFYRLLSLCPLLASSFHYWKERTKPGQNNSADAKGMDELVSLALSDVEYGLVQITVGRGEKYILAWVKLGKK